MDADSGLKETASEETEVRNQQEMFEAVGNPGDALQVSGRSGSVVSGRCFAN